MGLKVMDGDEAFYFLHEDSVLKGAVITHVDDFTLAGTEEFINKVLEIISRELTVSKIEKDNFRYTGIDVSTTDDGIEIQMEDYVESLKEIYEIRKANRKEELTKLQMKEYRKITGKLAWLANSTRPDLIYLS